MKGIEIRPGNGLFHSVGATKYVDMALMVHITKDALLGTRSLNAAPFMLITSSFRRLGK